MKEEDRSLLFYGQQKKDSLQAVWAEKKATLDSIVAANIEKHNARKDSIANALNEYVQQRDSALAVRKEQLKQTLDSLRKVREEERLVRDSIWQVKRDSLALVWEQQKSNKRQHKSCKKRFSDPGYERMEGILCTKYGLS